MEPNTAAERCCKRFRYLRLREPFSVGVGQLYYCCPPLHSLWKAALMTFCPRLLSQRHPADARFRLAAAARADCARMPASKKTCAFERQHRRILNAPDASLTQLPKSRILSLSRPWRQGVICVRACRQGCVHAQAPRSETQLASADPPALMSKHIDCHNGSRKGHGEAQEIQMHPVFLIAQRLC